MYIYIKVLVWLVYTLAVNLYFLQKYIKNVRTQNKCCILLLTGGELSTNEGVFCDKVIPYNTDAIC